MKVERQHLMPSFDLNNPDNYQQWRKLKLSWSQDESRFKPVQLDQDFLNKPEIAQQLAQRCHQHGFVIYRLEDGENAAKQHIINIGQQLGLQRLDSNLCADEDSISSIENQSNAIKQRYIPYTNRPLNWHTDGYYNPADKPIRAFILHCMRDAANGGENALYDHELAYIALRDENPAFITALQHPQAMSIPANQAGDQAIRDLQSGPVFSQPGRNLHMRYTARSHNIIWRDTTETREAVTFLQNLLLESDQVLRYRLSPGEGIISKNCLHRRDGFEDTEKQQRLFFRARYYDAVMDSAGGTADDLVK